MSTQIAVPSVMAAQAKSEVRRNKQLYKAAAPAKSLRYYTDLDYPVELVRDEDAYVASHPDLPGCVSFGPTPNEAVANLTEVKTLWLEGRLASGSTIPEPGTSERYSGKFVLRIPKSLHRMADHRARQEGVSLNSYITSALAGALNYPLQEATHRRIARNQIGSVELGFLKYWCRSSQNWDIEMLGANKNMNAKERKQELIWFTGAFAERIGNNSKSTINVSKLEDYHRAEEESNVISS